ncbi:MAG: DUF4286 family protein [Bacteroidia bacterium]
MIIYGVTVSVEKEIAEEWKTWMLDKHIPDVMNTGFFESFAVQKIIDPVVDPSMTTYNIQYTCESLEKLHTYQKEHSPALQKEHSERYANRFVAFRVILEKVG